MKEEEEEVSIDAAKKVQVSEKDACEVLISIENRKNKVQTSFFYEQLQVSDKEGASNYIGDFYIKTVE